MKLRCEFEITELGEQMVAVPVGDNATEFSGVLKLNDSAASILKLLKKDTTVDEIVSALMKEYDSNTEVITAFVNKFINSLREEDLLCE